MLEHFAFLSCSFYSFYVLCRFKNLQKHKSHFVRSAEDHRKEALWQNTVHRLTRNTESDSDIELDINDE